MACLDPFYQIQYNSDQLYNKKINKVRVYVNLLELTKISRH
jgi:hypothetical protein